MTTGSGDRQPNSADRQRVVQLEWATIVWNLGEFFVTVWLGITAGSIALIAFGVDSLIEVFASSVVIWHERSEGADDHRRTRRAHQLIAIAFFALAIALTISSTRRLLSGVAAEESIGGIIYLALVVVVMGWLAVWKRKLAIRIDSSPVAAEARVTFLDGILAFAILLALVGNAALGWWWLDPVAALAVAAVALHEGLENLSGDDD